MTCFCYFWRKKIFSFWTWPILTLFSTSWAPKQQFFEVLPKKNQNYWIAIKVININLIPNLFHWKSAKNNVGVAFGAKFGPNYVQCCEKSNKLALSIVFLYFAWGSKKQWLCKHLSENLRPM